MIRRRQRTVNEDKRRDGDTRGATHIERRHRPSKPLRNRKSYSALRLRISRSAHIRGAFKCNRESAVSTATWCIAQPLSACNSTERACFSESRFATTRNHLVFT